MANKSVTTCSEREAGLLLQLKRVGEELHEIQGVFDWLGALFGQLKESPIRGAELAEMGQYLADDYSSTVGAIKAALEEGLQEPALKRAA